MQKRDVSSELCFWEGLQVRENGMSPNFIPTPSSLIVQEEELMALETALQRLPLQHQQVIHWRNQERLPFSAIGQKLGRSEEAVRKLWVRALDMLRKEMAGDGAH
jgi:RNA polymerase sigma factor (sigma-70 family)